MAFDINKYKTYDDREGRGSTEQWQDMARKALMLENPEATEDEIEEKLAKITKAGRRKLKLD